MKNNHWYTKIAFFLLIIALSACIQSKEGDRNQESVPSVVDVPINPPHVTKVLSNQDTEMELGMDKLISGTIVENNLGCTVDATCFLVVSLADKEIDVIYAVGRGGVCLNSEAGNIAIGLKSGDIVEIFGQVTGSGEMSTCDSSAYYVKKISE